MVTYSLKKLGVLLFSFILLFSFALAAQASITDEECKRDLETGKQHLDECIDIWEGIRAEKSQQVTSLRAQIEEFDASIAAATAKIYKAIKEIEGLEKEIDNLTDKIGRLDLSLDQLAQILAKRVAETYKRGRGDILKLFFSSDNFSRFVSRYKYLKVAQLHDKQLMIQMETVRTTYADQKTIKEEKVEELDRAKKKLESLKIILAQQKEDRKRLLEDTQEDEGRYRQLISRAQAELVAIKGILTGQGREVQVGSVGQGQRIASIIAGRSCNSSGTHLHFMVVKGGETHNPLNYLRGDVSYENCSGSGCGSPDGDPFNPVGSWDWPLNPPIKFNQGYGKTWAVEHTWVGRVYPFHSGIDIVSDSPEVKTVKSGTLYQGVFQGEGGCNLYYVRVDHDDSDLDSYYLHVGY